jgi:hypothetical protein
MHRMTKREFLITSAGGGFGWSALRAASAQRRGSGGSILVSTRRARTTKLFRAPDGFPNAIAVVPEGLWIGEQKLSGAAAAQYKLAEPKDLTERAWLVDWNGKVLKTVETQSRNTSGMAVGGGYVWMCANAAPEGIFQVDMNSRQISHRQIPLGPAENGGGCHGGLWQNGKLWLVALRLRGILRVDPSSWQPEFLIPFYDSADRPRVHGIAWDKGSIWQIVGNDCKNHTEYRAALVRYDAATGRATEIVEFEPNSADPHGLAIHDGALISCDAGIHPGWENNDSPTSGWIFRIDLA